MTGVLGGQTVTLLTQSNGPLDRKGIPAKLYTPTVITNCSIQPIDVKEDVSNIDYALGKFNIFLPAVPAALTCKTTDFILGYTAAVLTADEPLATYLDGTGTQIYRVIGAKVWYGFMGVPDHVTVVAEIPSGING